MFNCFICSNSICNKFCNKSGILQYCEHTEKCKKYCVKYAFSYSDESRLDTFSFQALIKDSFYQFEYSKRFLYIFHGNKLIERIELPKPFEMIVSPDNCEKRLPALLTFN